MYRIFILFFIVMMSTTLMAGNYFPDDYKSFPFKEGDLLASKGQNSKYSINKVLRIDKITLKAGESINIQGRIFQAPEEDFLLIISMSYGEDEFNSLDEAKSAAQQGSWEVKMGHIPNRPPGAAQGQILVGNEPVKKEELDGYNLWKKAFIKGEAGVF